MLQMAKLILNNLPKIRKTGNGKITVSRSQPKRFYFYARTSNEKTGVHCIEFIWDDKKKMFKGEQPLNLVFNIPVEIKEGTRTKKGFKMNYRYVWLTEEQAVHVAQSNFFNMYDKLIKVEDYK